MKKVFLLSTLLCTIILTSCVDSHDNPVVGPDAPEVKDYAERLVPVVDPRGEAQGMVMLRFYNDMPSVAYVSISDFQSIMYPGTTVMVTKTAPNSMR
jgi:hypothetical protein